jgi:hypothetical protein
MKMHRFYRIIKKQIIYVMKTKLFSLAMLALITSFGMKANAQIQVSLYASIPLAPNFTLNVGINTNSHSAPSPDYVWIDDYYTWDYAANRYSWVQGFWALPPYLGAIWIPGYWEFTSRGYRWMDACWIPRNHSFSHGYYKDRYDYYGRPVYYHRPHIENRRAYAYSYDSNPNHRGRNFSSSAFYNNSPRNNHSGNSYRSPREETTDNHRKSGQNIRNNTINRQASNSKTPNNAVSPSTPSRERGQSKIERNTSEVRNKQNKVENSNSTRVRNEQGNSAERSQSRDNRKKNESSGRR